MTLSLPSRLSRSNVATAVAAPASVRLIATRTAGADRPEVVLAADVGDMTRDELEELPGDITIHSHATGHLRNELLNRARVVVSRSGYTTVMDLVEIGAKGVFIPTPKQTEQEYIASHHGSGSHFIAFGNQHNFDLSDILGRADRLEPFPAAHRTESTLRRIDAVISGLLEQAAP